MTPAAIINAAQKLLLEEGSGTTWAKGTLVDFLNLGRAATYEIRPDLFETTGNATLVAGSRQTLPDGSTRLFRPIANESHAKKRAITMVDERVLARHRPRWRSETASKETLHVLYNEADGNQYEVYPPGVADQTIKVSYAKPPTDVPQDASGGDLPEGTASSAYVDYVVARAHMVDTAATADSKQYAAAHMQIYQSILGLGAESKAASSPNQ